MKNKEETESTRLAGASSQPCFVIRPRLVWRLEIGCLQVMRVWSSRAFTETGKSVSVGSRGITGRRGSILGIESFFTDRGVTH